MLTLVAGGAACGKSEYAEGLAMNHGGRLVYIATMQPFGSDAAMRIERHRSLREGKGFETVEKYTRLGELDNISGTVLLECLSNLVANELFAPDATPDMARRSIFSGLEAMAAMAGNLIVVGNDIGSDGGRYPQETMEYAALLADVTRHLASRYDRVVEVVCGIPLWHLGGCGDAASSGTGGGI